MAVAVLQLYGQERNERYRKTADHAVEQQGIELRRLADSVEQQGIELRRLADAIKMLTFEAEAIAKAYVMENIEEQVRSIQTDDDD